MKFPLKGFWEIPLKSLGDKWGSKGEPDVDLGTQGHGPPTCVARHGPGFLELNGEERSQIRRLHHNLGHPLPTKLANFLKEGMRNQTWSEELWIFNVIVAPSHPRVLSPVGQP